MAEPLPVIGYFEIVGKYEPGKLNALKSQLTTALERANYVQGEEFRVHADFQNRRVVVHASNRLTRILYGQEEKRAGNAAEVRFTSLEGITTESVAELSERPHTQSDPTTSSDYNTSLTAEYERILGQLREAEEKNEQYQNERTDLQEIAAELRGELAGERDRYRQAQGTIGELQRSVQQVQANATTLEQKLAGYGTQLIKAAPPQEFYGALGANEDTYFAAQTELVGHVFAQVADILEKRELYQETEDITNARGVLARRDEYIAGGGIALIELLPPGIKEMTEQQWNLAEAIVERYDRKVAATAIIDFPVIVSSGENGITVSFPVDAQSTSPVARAIYGRLDSVKGALAGQNITAKISEDMSMAKIAVEGHALGYRTLENMLLAELGDVLQQAKLNIILIPLSYMTVSEFGIKLYSPAAADSMDDLTTFIVETLRADSRFGTKGFADDANFALANIGRGASAMPQTRKRLAEILGVDISEIERRLPKA